MEQELLNNKVEVAKLLARNLELNHQIKTIRAHDRIVNRERYAKEKMRDKHVAKYQRMGLNPDFYDASGKTIKEGQKTCEQHNLLECDKCR